MNAGAKSEAGDVHNAASATFGVTRMTQPLDHPWGFDFLPDGAVLVNERDGRMHYLPPDFGQVTQVEGVPEVRASGQGGLLDLVVALDFETSRRIYFTFSEPGPGGAGTAAATAEFMQDDAGPRLENVRVIARMTRKTSAGRHFGSRIVPAPDGTVYVTTGDRGDSDRAQDPFDHAGSVLRVRADGSIPADNPFADGKKGLPELWSMGHRNIQGAALHPDTGELWTVEHGARGGDEINRPQAGLNYGWPVISYGRHYSGGKIGVGTAAKGYEQPVHYWDPSIAPSGMAFYTGNTIPEWTGDMFVGALKDQMIVRLGIDAGKVVGEEHLLEGDYGRIRTIRNGPDGALWFSTDEPDGALYRIGAAP
nr:PQQ-dependent sugar dehydrogenase [Hongsoonwoonella zoysiae]